ncbi:MAG: hypothetical protein AAF497_26310, partial [Planctomycetota bacterium]
MVDENPYVAPSAPAAETEIIDQPSPPRLLTGILLFVGTCFLLLLNGQHFTNRLIFLGFVAASALLWYRHRGRNRSRNPNAGRFALLIHVILLVAFAATLPDAYSRQNGFNNAIKRIYTHSPNPTLSASVNLVFPLGLLKTFFCCSRLAGLVNLLVVQAA